jgi:hypothetical protein
MERVANQFKRKRLLPFKVRAAMREFGTGLERSIKRSAFEAGIKPSTGRMQKRGIRYEQRPNGNVGTLKILQDYLYLDDMNPHWVSVKRSRGALLRWAQKASSSTIRRAANRVASGKQSSFAFRVRPHPYIERGYTRQRAQLPKILQKHAESKQA